MTHVYGSDEEEVEKFEVTNDDILNEFNPNRPTFRQSKSDALYGIWAKPEESGYNEFKNKSKKDLSKPLTFISGGLKGEEQETEGNDDNESTSRSAEFQPVKNIGNKTPKRKGGHHVYSLQNKSREKLTSDFASFERHTKGIGMKLMQKMGYKIGKGLGVANQGIVNPVEALKRQKKAGLGAAGTERTKQSLIHFPRQDSEEDEENKIREQISRWRKDDAAETKDYKYKTVDELKKSGKKVKKRKEIQVLPHSQSAPALSNVKVIDMTGKEQKVLSGYHAITSRNVDDSDSGHAAEEPHFPANFTCPELEHNIELLLNSTEQKILHNDKQLVYEQDRSISLKHQLTALEKTIVDEKTDISKLEVILETIDHCEKRLNSSVNVEFLLDEMVDVFKNLQENNYTEYCMFQLSDLVVAFVYPLLKKYFTAWNPLEDSSFGITEMKRWKSLIQLDKGSLKLTENGQNYQASDMYEHILWEVWMPALRTSVLKWNPRNCECLIELLENWLPILPQWIMENVFLQLVLPRLQQEVENWNPLTDPVPLDSWIHPWLPLMESRMDPLYGPIKEKLGSALQLWHPRDPSAKVILEPWSKVFPRGSWDAFIIKYILPKLNKCIDEFTVNPKDQSLSDFQCIMQWHSLIPEASVVSLLEKHFFAKWLRALSAWLNLEDVDYDEVSRWYAGWKSEIPSAIRSNPFIKERFKQALDIMNRAITGQPPLPTEMPSQYYAPGVNQSSKLLHPLSQASSSNAAMPGNFKDLLLQRAEERGIIFMRLTRSIDGKVVYRLGDNLVYIERDVIFLRRGNMFVPVSIETALNAGSKST